MATDEEKKKDPRTVQLKRVRLSFTDSLKDKKKTAKTEDAVPKYSCNLILETDQPEFEANKAKCRVAMEEAGERAWKNREAYKTMMEDDPKRVCYRKGEKFKNQETGEIYKGYAGNWAISAGTPASGQKRPKLYDRRKTPHRDTATREQLDRGQFFEDDKILDVMYGGSYADVFVSFYGTDKGGRGIFCTIEAIRSHEEGERMGGGVYVDADDFDDLEDADDAFAGTASAAEDPLG